jgi:acyl carrier protein
MTSWTSSALISELQVAIAAYVGLDPADVDPDQPLDLLGMDSLTAAQLAIDIEDRLGVSLFLNDLSGRETIAELAASVISERAS